MAGNRMRRAAAPDAVVHEIGFLTVEEHHKRREERGRADHEDDDEQRVVYDDLDADDAHHVPLATDAKPKRDAVRPPKQRVLAQPTQLFASHTVLGFGGEDVIVEEDEEEEEEEEANPFAALLHVHTQPKNIVSPPPPRHSAIRRSPVKHVTPPSPPLPSNASPPKPKPKPLPRAKRSLSPPPEQPTRAPPSSRSVSSTRSLMTTTVATRSLVPAIEAADARPSRWTRTAPTATTTTKRRRESTASSSIAKQQAEAKRRKSMPASLTDNVHQTGGRRLSDVLTKATTMLSQDRTAMPMVDQSFSSTVRETDDGIVDTVAEMRNEPFQTQFFSPSKIASSSNKRPRADAVLAKIRGSLGDAVRKAVRKTNRDLTLLRSQGQTLLGRGDLHQDSAHDIHNRDFVVVQLERPVTHPHLVTFDGVVHDLCITPSGTEDSAVPKEGSKLTIVFSASDATQQLTRGAQLKIFAPFQIVDEWCGPGMRRQRRHRRKFLMGTSLFEIVGHGDA